MSVPRGALQACLARVLLCFASQSVSKGFISVALSAGRAQLLKTRGTKRDAVRRSVQ